MSKALRRLKEQIEIDFLKSKTYTEINEMFNQMKQKVDEAEGKLKSLGIADGVGKSEQLLFSLDDIERIVNEKSMFNGKQFRKMFEK